MSAAIGAVAVLGLGVIGFAGGGGSSDADADTPPAPAAAVAVAPSSSTPLVPTGVDPSLPDLVGDEPVADAAPLDAETCDMEPEPVHLGATGETVRCLQAGLTAAGVYDGDQDGAFDDDVYAAVLEYQEAQGLFVDGVAGRETARALGVWPDEQSLVVRTPPPPEGAMDSHGYTLSSVASTGSDAPPLPENSGSGKRVVYQRAGQRVWAVDEDERVIRSWLVSGSQYQNEVPGTHTVYSRSEESSAWNLQAKLPLMIRYYRTDIGHIGFHAIPLSADDGSPYQTEDELGTRLSGGCQRQANLDAIFLWNFAPEGTKVVVI
jgi:hypothetical protein